MTDFDAVSVETADHVALITLNAPERRNALTVSMARGLVAACDAIDADSGIGAAVVRGAGGHFCAGAHRDLLGAAGADPLHPEHYAATSAIYEAFFRFGQLAVPTVAAVRGVTVGAGTNLMLAADLRLVASDARIIGGFARIDLHPGGGFFHLVSRAAGRQTAMALGVFDEEIDGDRAAAIGLAWRAHPDGEVEEHALRLARAAGRDPELARAVTRSARHEAAGVDWPVALEYERAAQLWSLRRRRLAGEPASD